MFRHFRTMPGLWQQALTLRLVPTLPATLHSVTGHRWNLATTLFKNIAASCLTASLLAHRTQAPSTSIYMVPGWLSPAHAPLPLTIHLYKVVCRLAAPLSPGSMVKIPTLRSCRQSRLDRTLHFYKTPVQVLGMGNPKTWLLWSWAAAGRHTDSLVCTEASVLSETIFMNIFFSF